ncbi:EAL domain-containing protein [Vogesella sp. LIG4]|uniref:EAL domain-containing protein n=1 Tax=Vogesella sp. LIG4 TaxID=1192162 RepID=UPI00081FAC41|nr:EAL domain-containing protein [Vogesella sp. LIG4]SCK12791.1 EAL domain, c-di-GMP-specific phosphodiesterase class I (or its enzymatically inactive variant) [Vogesella sp. LIG4]
MTQPLTLATLLPALQRDEAGRYQASFADYRLASVFQPVYYRSGSIFGHEALLRVQAADGSALRPDLLFTGLDEPDARRLDALALLMHLHNFAQARCAGCLSLNVQATSLQVDGLLPMLQQLLAALGLGADGVVLEVLEYELEHSPLQLAGSLRRFSQAGFGLAIDDFGATASSHGRTRALCPDIIKFDRCMLLDQQQGDGGRMARELQLAWQIGCRSVVCGVETAEQHSAMQELGLELYQGYHLARPAPLPVCELL